MDVDHEALCREAIVQARLLAQDSDGIQQLPPVLRQTEQLGEMVQKSGWPPRFRALLWAMAGNELRRRAEANGRYCSVDSQL